MSEEDLYKKIADIEKRVEELEQHSIRKVRCKNCFHRVPAAEIGPGSKCPKCGDWL